MSALRAAMSLGSTPSRCKPPIPAAPRAAAKLATSAAKVAGKRKQKKRRKIDSSSYSSSSSTDYETKSKRIIAKDARKQKALQARFKDNGAESDQILAKYPQLFSSLSSADTTWVLTSQQRLLDSSGSPQDRTREREAPGAGKLGKDPSSASAGKDPSSASWQGRSGSGCAKGKKRSAGTEGCVGTSCCRWSTVSYEDEGSSDRVFARWSERARCCRTLRRQSFCRD